MARRSSKTVTRSATSGRFVTKAFARRAPSRTTTERVGGNTRNRRACSRSAATGRFVKKTTTARRPSTTITQRV